MRAVVSGSHVLAWQRLLTRLGAQLDGVAARVELALVVRRQLSEELLVQRDGRAVAVPVVVRGKRLLQPCQLLRGRAYVRPPDPNRRVPKQFIASCACGWLSEPSRGYNNARGPVVSVPSLGVPCVC